MINWLKLILTFFQNSYDNIVTIFEQQLKTHSLLSGFFVPILFYIRQFQVLLLKNNLQSFHALWLNRASILF